MVRNRGLSESIVVVALLLYSCNTFADELNSQASQPVAPGDLAAGKVESSLGDEQALLAGGTAARPGQPGDFCRCVGETDTATLSRIQTALNSRLKSEGFDFNDTALEEVVHFLQEEYEIPIQIDSPAFETIGMDPSEPVTVNLRDISLRSALRLILERLGLTYVIRDEVIMVTTPEEAEKRLQVCVYDVRELLSDKTNRATDALVDTIVSCVSRNTWSENGGGEAEIRSLQPGLLVISQMQSVHEEINSLLSAIRALRQVDPALGLGMVDEEADSKVVTSSYTLQLHYEGDSQRVIKQVRDLIVQTFPEEQWDGQLPDGQSVTLAVLPDRIIVRHLPEIQKRVATLMSETGIAIAAESSSGSRGRHAGGPEAGMGGGGGFFSPRVP